MNPELMIILHDLEFVEQTGFCVPTIFDVYGESAYEFMDNFVKVTIPFDEEVMAMMGKNVHENVSENVQEKDVDKIIDYIRNNCDCTLDNMAKKIGKSIKTIQRIIKNSKRVKRVDSGEGGHWEVID